MNKYAAFAGNTWLFNLHADNEMEALKLAQHQDATITHVLLTDEEL